jgi:cell division protein FtsL
MATAPRAEGALPGAARASTLPIVLIIAAMIVGLTAMLPLVQSSGATSIAGSVQRLQEDKAALQARLRELETEVATLGSLGRIQQEAKVRLEMEQPKDVRYIRVDLPPPADRRLPSRFLPPQQEPVPANDDSSLWEKLFGWLP